MRVGAGAAAALVLAVAASMQGCGKPVLRVADASLGDYYTDREFKKLSKEQREEYCAELARQDSIYRNELLDLRRELDQSRARSLELREEGDSLFGLASELDARYQSEREGRAGKTVHIVRAGETLWRISASRKGYGAGSEWRRIYEANRGRVRDPDLIYPGQELFIPR